MMGRPYLWLVDNTLHFITTSTDQRTIQTNLLSIRTLRSNTTQTHTTTVALLRVVLLLTQIGAQFTLAERKGSQSLQSHPQG